MFVRWCEESEIKLKICLVIQYIVRKHNPISTLFSLTRLVSEINPHLKQLHYGRGRALIGMLMLILFFNECKEI